MKPETSPLVVGIDGSQRSLDALALAARLAEPGQHLLLIHVHQGGRLSNLAAVQAFLDRATDCVMHTASDTSPAHGLQATAGKPALR